jgi:hypothetical protein
MDSILTKYDDLLRRIDELNERDMELLQYLRGSFEEANAELDQSVEGLVHQIDDNITNKLRVVGKSIKQLRDIDSRVSTVQNTLRITASACEGLGLLEDRGCITPRQVEEKK